MIYLLDDFLLWGIILCVVGCLAISLSCPFRMPVAHHPQLEEPEMSPDIDKCLGEGVCSSTWLRTIELSGSLITYMYLLAVDAVCSNRLGILKLLIHRRPSLILHLPIVRSRKFRDTAISRALVLTRQG